MTSHSQPKIFTEDLLVRDALLRHDAKVTRVFFYQQCYPLFKSIYDNYYTDCACVKEFIDEIYVLALAPSKTTGKCQLENFMKNEQIFKSLSNNILNKISFKEFFGKILSTIGKTNNPYLIVNYSTEMAIDSFRKAKEVHSQGQAYKDLISKMFFLDDDFNNDTVQFDMAIERFKMNSGHIEQEIKHLTDSSNNSSLFDIESFCIDNEDCIDLHKRFID